MMILKPDGERSLQQEEQKRTNQKEIPRQDQPPCTPTGLHLIKILPMSLADIDRVASGNESPSDVEHSVFSGHGKDVVN